MFPYPPDSGDKRGRKRSEQNRVEAQRLFTEGRGNDLPGMAGTLWAAYNGVTEFIDHGKTKRDAAGHLDHIWFGDGSAVKARAFEVAQKRLGA